VVGLSSSATVDHGEMQLWDADVAAVPRGTVVSAELPGFLEPGIS
jgi:hypothetical protein